MKIWLDLDNTLNDLIFKWIDYCNELTGKSIKVTDVKYWNHVFDIFGEECALTFFSNQPFEQNIIKPLKESTKFVETLKNDYEVIILTDTFWKMEPEKRKWIETHFPNTDYILSKGDKYKYIDKNDIFIDDNTNHIKSAKCNLKILFNYKNMYNWTLQHPQLLQEDTVKVSTDYNEVIELIENNR